MQIVLFADSEPAVIDADVFNRFEAIVDEPSLARLAAGKNIHGIDFEAPDHLWISASALANWAGRSHDEVWLDHLASMIAYAQTRGWTRDSSGVQIRAHIQNQPLPPD